VFWPIFCILEQEEDLKALFALEKATNRSSSALVRLTILHPVLDRNKIPSSGFSKNRNRLSIFKEKPWISDA